MGSEKLRHGCNGSLQGMWTRSDSINTQIRKESCVNPPPPLIPDKWEGRTGDSGYGEGWCT